MAALKLTDLPPELLTEIISNSLPEGFASLASTCKRIYLLCTPFIEHHKHRCSLFKSIEYKWEQYNRERRDGLVAHVQLESAFHLITRIAFEPIVARYIINADLSMDSYPPTSKPSVTVPDIHDGGPVVALFANSPYLRDAGLDWKEYYRVMKYDLRDNPAYSQHAAIFLLTLLPNVRTLALPVLWHQYESTNQILDVIVRKARSSTHPWSTSSLNQVTSFLPATTMGIGSLSHLDQAMAFLALPRMRSFRALSSVRIRLPSTPVSFACMNQYPHYGTFLETLSFPRSCIDEGTIAEYLRHTPHLKKFTYSRNASNRFWDWNVCEFVKAIEREVGSHLEELSVSTSIRDPEEHFSFPSSSKPDRAVTAVTAVTAVAPCKINMRGFQCLRKLEFPLDIAICNLNDAARQSNTANEDLSYEGLEGYDLFGTLVPPSVTTLSLLSDGRDGHEKALQAMFRGFSAKKSSRYPVLSEIYISCPSWPRAYDKECKKVAGEIEKTGVVFHGHRSPSNVIGIL